MAGWYCGGYVVGTQVAPGTACGGAGGAACGCQGLMSCSMSRCQVLQRLCKVVLWSAVECC